MRLIKIVNRSIGLMKVEFLFNGIKNMEKLYNVKMIDSPFGGEDKAPLYEYIGDTYCGNVVAEVVSRIADAQRYSYQGDSERIANEVFVISSATKKYILSFTIDTYNHEKSRMRISITYKDGDVIAETKPKFVFSDGVEYDSFLEQLKIELKNVLKKDWNVCVWITDDQTEMLCSHLYPCIFKVENKIRAFAIKILVHNFGTDWLRQPGLEKYFASHRSLSGDFKRVVPCFADIDDTFIAMTMETMFMVIRKAKIYENAITLTDEDCREIHQKISEDRSKSIFDSLVKKRKIKVDFWEDIFKQYFAPETDSLKAITDFIKDRNHVAHNKLLNWSGYQTMFQNIDSLDKIINRANTQFEESVPSEELYMTWDAEEEAQRDAEAKADWEKNYLRIRIEGETGVEILHEDGIFDLFSEKLGELYTEIEDSYYFNPCYKVSEQYGLEPTEDKQPLFSVTSKAVEDSSIEILVEFSLDGAMNGDSVATLICKKAGEATEELFRSSLHYHNGSGYEDSFEGTIMLDSESGYDDSELDEFKQQLEEYIENWLNPLVEKLEALEYEAQRHGGPEPVADFPCYECEKNGVSAMEDFYPIGRCCYCGTDNEVSTCERCGTVFGDDGGTNGFCNGCLTEIDAD